MREIILTGIALLIITALMAGIDISTKPFHVKFSNPYSALGFILIIAGAFFIYHQGVINGDKH